MSEPSSVTSTTGPFKLDKHHAKKPPQLKKLTLGFLEFAENYRFSAQALYRTMEPELSSYAAFPIVFLYRHAIELMLKGILIELDISFSISRQTVRDRSHCLNKQLNDLYLIARKIGFEIDDDVKKYIEEIDKIDPSSMKFRYPNRPSPKEIEKERKKKEKSVKNEESNSNMNEDFNIEAFIHKSEKILKELHALSEQLYPAMECEIKNYLKETYPELGLE